MVVTGEVVVNQSRVGFSIAGFQDAGETEDDSVFNFGCDSNFGYFRDERYLEWIASSLWDEWWAVQPHCRREEVIR